ncbi:hypothetical protein ElyMa_003213000 [Elysia marginata]|uniref:Uncharacterized protein n=1 Tax=Elysia marginata TaxID=1093978 RepID=A0AAV4J622_9GAST|nr:hypothetical protein ElyMa_003213000 [Elysia marginata]
MSVMRFRTMTHNVDNNHDFGNTLPNSAEYWFKEKEELLKTISDDDDRDKDVMMIETLLMVPIVVMSLRAVHW